MEWTLTGHAIVSPSYRVTFQTVRRTYCALSISAQDTYALVLALERKLDGSMAQAQLVNGSCFLLSLLGKQALDVFPPRDKSWDDQNWQVAKNLREDIALNSSDPGMIWNPANSSVFAAQRLSLSRISGANTAPIHSLRLTILGALDNHFA